MTTDDMINLLNRAAIAALAGLTIGGIIVLIYGLVTA